MSKTFKNEKNNSTEAQHSSNETENLKGINNREEANVNENRTTDDSEFSDTSLGLLPMVEKWAVSKSGLGLSEKELVVAETKLENLELTGYSTFRLTKSVKIPMPLKVMKQWKHQIKASQIFRDIAMDRELIAGAYVVIGGPKSGKSAFVESCVDQLKLTGLKAGYLSVFEPTDVELLRKESLSSLTLWEEIEQGLSIALLSDLDVILIDSLRFLNAESPYPAKTKGINSGLEIYATLVNAIAERSGKMIFTVLSTSDADPEVTKLYQALMVGSAQGIITPSRLQATQIGTRRGEGEVSLRNGSRENQSFNFTTKEVITGTLVVDSKEVLLQTEKEAAEDAFNTSAETVDFTDSSIASRFLHNINTNLKG